jgi:hypothetical protein
MELNDSTRFHQNAFSDRHTFLLGNMLLARLFRRHRHRRLERP